MKRCVTGQQSVQVCVEWREEADDGILGLTRRLKGTGEHGHWQENAGWGPMLSYPVAIRE